MTRRVQGVSKLRRLLRKMPDDMTREVKNAVRDSANKLERDMAREAPVDDGDLRDALKSNVSRDGLSARVGYWKKGNLRNWRKAGWRAAFTIFGTRGAPEQNIPAQTGNNFVGRVAKRQETEIKNRINKAVDSALDKFRRG